MAIINPAGFGAVIGGGITNTMPAVSGTVTNDATLKIVTLSGDATANSTTTVAGITGLDLVVGTGTYNFTYWLRYQSAVTTTGVKFAVNHSGTTTMFQYWMRYVDTTATATTANASMAQATGAAATTMGAWSTRTKNTTLGPTIGVDSNNNDMMIIIEGMMIVTVSGTMSLLHGSEVAAASTVKAASNLILIKVA